MTLSPPIQMPAGEADVGELRRRKATGSAPLSYAQERMWFLNQMEPGSTVYSGVRATRWTGPLDRVALERTVGELLRRHEVLRTRFPLRSGGPVQEVEPAGPYELPLVDLSSPHPAAAMAEARSWLLAASRRPFELTRETPFRASLLRLGENDHVLALTIHHIAFDRWSRSILRRELGLLYTAFAAGRIDPLPDPPLQYQDFAEWQRERMRSDSVAVALEYWRGRLAGAPAVLRLPSDHPRQASASSLGRQDGFTLPDALVERLGELARRERVTLFMVLLTAFKALLARMTGQSDLVVGVPIAGRTRVELSGLIGCFTNTLVLRSDASGDPTFRELLGRVRNVALDGYAHQDLPFERLVRELHPERKLGQHPLFQVLFNYLDFPPERIAPPGMQIEDLDVASETALVDLGVEIRRAGRTLTCSITGNAALFEASTISRLAQAYRAALEALVADPESRISALPDPWPEAESVTDRVASLSPAKRALLELRRKQARAAEAATANGLPPIIRRGPLGSAPLSFAQQRLWFLDQLQPGRPLYNVPCRAWLHGLVDVAALRRALNEVIARHESLRTTFPASNGQPVQSIAAQVTCDLPLIDLTSVPVERREAEVRRVATEQAREPFDLARGPLVRARLVRLAEDEHALILMLHHIVADGWSVGVLFRELGTLYEAFSQGLASPLPELTIQYADYALTQREWLQGAVLERELGYWKEQFRTLPPPLQLPSDRPRPAAPSHAGSRVHFKLPPALRERLEDLSRSQGATLFMTLLAAFKALLAHCTGRDDIVVGTPIAGRTRPETEGLIGCFVNTLALRTDLSDDPTFRELVARVREVALGAYAHQELPFERLVEELQPERDTSQAPLFNVMFVLQNVPRTERRLRGLTMRHIELDKGTAKFDLSLGLAEKAGGLRGVLSYSTDLFDRETIDRLTEQYRNLLIAVADEPERRLSTLPLLNAAERRTVLVDWNATQCTWPDGEACLHSLVARQAAATPNVVAVVDESGELTYEELDRRANRLAHRLRRLGVGPEARVGVCLERSIDLVVALLAVLKAGGAYVPLDPSHPRERLDFMLRDSRAQVLLSTSRLRWELSSRGNQVLCLDAEAEGLAGEPSEAPESGVSADNLAYVMYTSGSTGTPKGVMVAHRAVLNHLRWRRGYFPLSIADRGLHKASVSFDDSVWEIFEPLLAGARLILARPGGQADPSYLVELIAEQQVTTACFVPSLLRSFLDEPNFERCASLRRVTTGGETLSLELQERFFTRLQASLHNGYGPTEATISATFWTCERESTRRFVPIGRPIANTQVYLLDRYLRPVPVGVAGELYIGGDGLSRGYSGRPGLTAERFVPDPFSEVPGARLYQSGDRARYRADGTLEFLGRLDFQVKIRGIRVEPGEIAATLLEHPGVGECIVVTREDDPGDRRLVAYLVPGPDRSPPGIEELSGFLQGRLPEPMIPSAFVLLDAMPLTPHGKVDRRALPAPEYSRAALADLVTPRTPVEKEIAGIWMALLKVETVGVHDNFFSLGGHSLLAAQVVARLRAAFGLDLPLRALFETPTVAGLAERIETTTRLLEEVASLTTDQIRVELTRENG